MKILITGATGFIGKELCNKLVSEGHLIIGISRDPDLHISSNSNLRFLKYELGNVLPNEVIEFEPELLYHLSWEGIPDFSDSICIKNLLDQVKFFLELKKITSLKKIIASGTCAEYGLDNGKCHENTIQYATYFGWSKSSIRGFLEIYCKDIGLKFVWLRIFYVYGPNQRSKSLVPYLMEMSFKKNNILLNNPHASHDFIYIDDVVTSFISALSEWNVEGVFNIGTGVLTKVSEIKKMVEENFDYRHKDSVTLAVNDPTSLNFEEEDFGIYADVGKSKIELRWEPKVAIQEGLKLSCRDFKKNNESKH